MLFVSDTPLNDDLPCEPDEVKSFLRKATDEELCNDYIFLKALDYGYSYSEFDFLEPINEFGNRDYSGCLYDSFINCLEIYLEYLYDEVMHRFIIKTRERLSNSESEE